MAYLLALFTDEFSVFDRGFVPAKAVMKLCSIVQ
jgi:hypothetical protein